MLRCRCALMGKERGLQILHYASTASCADESCIIMCAGCSVTIAVISADAKEAAALWSAKRPSISFKWAGKPQRLSRGCWIITCMLAVAVANFARCNARVFRSSEKAVRGVE